MDFDFAQGTEFEKKVMRWLWGIKKNDAIYLCKPDIYDVSTNTMIEAKYTRPYYNLMPSNPDSIDIGTGLPINQYRRYVKMREHGIKVVLVHKMSQGKFKDRIFISELTDDLVSKTNVSDGGKTVYWLYEDLTIKNINI